MRIESLEEFCTLSKLLNYTKASLELHESQSTLSRHIKAMEIELGFPLIGNTNNQLFVTREGNVFLNGVYSMVEDYRNLVNECRELRESLTSELLIQEPPYQDTAGISFLRLMARFKAVNPHTFIRYKDPHMDPMESLIEGTVDVALDYRYGEPESLVAEYREMGLDPVFICDAPLLVCCRTESELAKKDSVGILDILPYPIMVMYDTFSPARRALEELLEGHDAQPQIINCAVSTVFEFFMAPIPDDGLYILPEGADRSVQMLSREEFAFVPLRDATLHFFAVFRPSYDDLNDLVALHKHLETTRSE